MIQQLHPSEIHTHLVNYHRAVKTSLASLGLSAVLFAAGVTCRVPLLKPILFGSTLAAAYISKEQRKTAKQTKLLLADIETISLDARRDRLVTLTRPTAAMLLTVGHSLEVGYVPPNLITDPVEYLEKRKKHVALIGGTGDGKSTQVQYLSTRIGGKVTVYDADCTPQEWSWLPSNNVIGRKGDIAAIDAAMGEDLTILQELMEKRGEHGDSAIAGLDRFIVAEEFPLLADECKNAPTWIKRHAKRGRRVRQFICVIAQNDTAENFALEGDKGTLDSCFALIRLGKFAQDHAKRLKQPELEQWLKDGGKKRFMIDDSPCELDLSSFGAPLPPSKESPLPDTHNLLPNTHDPIAPEQLIETLEFPEQNIVRLGLNKLDTWLPAWKLQNLDRSLRSLNKEEIRILCAALADRGIGEVVGDGEKLQWRITQQCLDAL